MGRAGARERVLGRTRPRSRSCSVATAPKQVDAIVDELANAIQRTTRRRDRADVKDRLPR